MARLTLCLLTLALLLPQLRAAPAPDPLSPEIRKAAKAVRERHVPWYLFPGGRISDEKKKALVPEFDKAL